MSGCACVCVGNVCLFAVARTPSILYLFVEKLFLRKVLCLDSTLESLLCELFGLPPTLLHPGLATNVPCGTVSHCPRTKVTAASASASTSASVSLSASVDGFQRNDRRSEAKRSTRQIHKARQQEHNHHQPPFASPLPPQHPASQKSSESYHLTHTATPPVCAHLLLPVAGHGSS